MNDAMAKSGRGRALVVGGGIAGSVAAIALRKAGFEPLILESRGPADGEGAFLTLAVNGIETLATLGLDARSFGGFDTPRFALRLGDGSELATIPSGPARPNGAVSQTIKRADLYRALRLEA